MTIGSDWSDAGPPDFEGLIVGDAVADEPDLLTARGGSDFLLRGSGVDVAGGLGADEVVTAEGEDARDGALKVNLPSPRAMIVNELRM